MIDPPLGVGYLQPLDCIKRQMNIVYPLLNSIYLRNILIIYISEGIAKVTGCKAEELGFD
jgi:hypothetical protein